MRTVCLAARFEQTGADLAWSRHCQKPPAAIAAGRLSGPKPMAALQFIIARHRPTRRWTLEINRQAYGEYPSECEALMHAIDLAREASEQGREAEVLFQSAGGEYRVGWTFGRVPYSETVSRTDNEK